MILSRLLGFGLKTTKLQPGHYDYLDLVRPPIENPLRITPEEKQKINLQIDKKLQQLEDTGLSRQQILLSKSQKGLPLALDPFFQYIKKNRLAREIYLKKSDRFTVEKIVDIALRQDIGPDPSYSRTRQNGKINQKGRAELMNDLQDREPSSFNPTSYYANKQTTINKLYDELKPHQPLRHIYTPINRYEKIKTQQKRLKKYDIHWRNIELLRQFLTPYGNIKNRWANRLSPSDQNNVKRAINASRHNCGIPHFGRFLEPNKRNITNIDDEVQEIGMQSVNLETGEVFYSRSKSMDKLQVELVNKSDTDWRYQKMLAGQTHPLWIDRPDTDIDPELARAEQYARILKEQENKTKPERKSEMGELVKYAMKEITGLTPEEKRDMELSQLTEQQKQQLKGAFQSRKKLLSSKIDAQPQLFSQIILQEKTVVV